MGSQSDSAVPAAGSTLLQPCVHPGHPIQWHPRSSPCPPPGSPHLITCSAWHHCQSHPSAQGLPAHTCTSRQGKRHPHTISTIPAFPPPGAAGGSTSHRNGTPSLAPVAVCALRRGPAWPKQGRQGLPWPLQLPAESQPSPGQNLPGSTPLLAPRTKLVGPPQPRQAPGAGCCLAKPSASDPAHPAAVLPSYTAWGWQDWLSWFGWQQQLPGTRTWLDGAGRLSPARMAGGSEAPVPRAHDGNAGQHAQCWHLVAMHRGAGQVPTSSSVPASGNSPQQAPAQPHIARTCPWLNSSLISLLSLQ